MSKDRETSYDSGRFDFGPGKVGLWFVRRTTTEVIALAESSSAAQQIINAYKAADNARSS